MYKTILSYPEISGWAKFQARVMANHNHIDYEGPVVYTHDQTFHADEVFAVALIEMCVEKRLKIIRTRKTDILEARDKARDIVLDIGEIFDPEIGQIDHHQIGFDKSYSILNKDDQVEQVLMATCGLVWSLIGKLLINKTIVKWHDAIGLDSANLGERISDMIQFVFTGMRTFLYQVDATDNGRYDTLGSSKATSLTSIISLYNSDDVNDAKSQDWYFREAVQVVKPLILKKILNLAKKYLAKDKIMMALAQAMKEQLQYILLEEPGTPWRDTVIEQWNHFKDIQLCVFKCSEDDWRVQTLPENRKDFTSMRCPAPEPWRGIKHEKLVGKTGLDDIVFIHRTGFLGGCKTKDSAIKLAEYWLNFSQAKYWLK